VYNNLCDCPNLIHIPGYYKGYDYQWRSEGGAPLAPCLGSQPMLGIGKQPYLVYGQAIRFVCGLLGYFLSATLTHSCCWGGTKLICFANYVVGLPCVCQGRVIKSKKYGQFEGYKISKSRRIKLRLKNKPEVIETVCFTRIRSNGWNMKVEQKWTNSSPGRRYVSLPINDFWRRFEIF